MKSSDKIEKIAMALVAPFTGAWIEIIKRQDDTQARPVAPFTGAWIEICA